MFSIFVVSLVCSVGLAILLVEKEEEWPVTLVTVPLRKILSKISPKLERVLDCTVCAAFWTALASDLFFWLVIGTQYFLWPFSGFAAVGIVWFIMEFLNVLDRTTQDEDE